MAITISFDSSSFIDEKRAAASISCIRQRAEEQGQRRHENRNGQTKQKFGQTQRGFQVIGKVGEDAVCRQKKNTLYAPKLPTDQRNLFPQKTGEGNASSILSLTGSFSGLQNCFL